MDPTAGTEHDPDRRLLYQVAAGDQAALELLYARHGRALLGYAEGILADRQRAEEAVQDTLLAVWRGATTFQARSTVRTWLFGICRRQALRRVDPRGPVHLSIDLATGLAAGEPGPETVMLARADARAVAAAIGDLAPIHREVLDLAFGAGLAHDEIAAVLEVPVGTVKSRLHHARAVLARALPVAVDGAPEPARTTAARGGGG